MTIQERAEKAFPPGDCDIAEWGDFRQRVVDALEAQREAHAQIVNELMEEVRSKCLGAEYHLVVAMKLIRDTP